MRVQTVLLNEKLASLGRREAEVLHTLARAFPGAFTRQGGMAATGLAYSPLNRVLASLLRKGWVLRASRNLYKINTVAGVGVLQRAAADPPTILALFSQAMLSHWSAMAYHHLTDQVVLRVFLTTTDRRRRVAIVVGGVPVAVDWTRPAWYFGATVHWEGSQKVAVSDLERTLLDGLRHPQRCGGLPHVLIAWRQAAHRVNWPRLDEYLGRFGKRALVQRVGAVADRLAVIPARFRARWLAARGKSYPLLDPALPATGPLDTTWRVRLNHPIGERDDT